MKSKNKKTLDSFKKYCQENLDQRFWQALRNWAKVGFICTSEDGKEFEDTFYKE